MIPNLTATTTTFRGLMSASHTTTAPVAVVAFHDLPRITKTDTAEYPRAPKFTTFDGTNEVTLCSAPDADQARVIDSVDIYNVDTVANTFTLFYDDGTNRTFKKVTLQTGETLHGEFYLGGRGWYVMDVNGNIKVTTAGTQTFSWTPTLTFATAGDLSVAYTTRLGYGIVTGTMVTAWFNILSSSFTHTTAAGNAQITGLGYTPSANYSTGRGPLTWQGITKANYTDISTNISASSATIIMRASGSGQTGAAITTADMPTGGTVSLQGQVQFFV